MEKIDADPLDAPRAITVSEELDTDAPGDELASDLIDGTIGDGTRSR